MISSRCKFVALLVISLTTVGVYLGCRSTPVTARKQILLVPESQEISMGLSAYEQILAEETPSSNRHYIEMVNRVGQRIAAVSGRPEYQWEFRVIASETQNAFALPGGKVAVYEGILSVCANEAGLAVVMSHEVAHVLARHGGERMSHTMVVDGMKKAVDYFSKSRAEAHHDRIMSAYGIASKYGVVLPYSRKQESEADHIGVMLMAEAGYDPREAPVFWERFGQAGAGQKPPEFMSTHPADATRARDLRNLLPAATEKYAQAPTKYGFGEPLVIARAAGGASVAPQMTPVTSSFAPPTGQPNFPYTPQVQQLPPQVPWPYPQPGALLMVVPGGSGQR